MLTGVIILLIFLFLLTLYLTLRILRNEEAKMKKYEEEGDTIEDQLRRSHEYEQRSLKTSVPFQIWFYIGVFVVFSIAFVIYLKIIQ